MISQMTKKIELKFWDVVIPWLSKSSRLQKMITKLADLYHNENFVKQVVLFVVIAFAGFACGFLIFSLSTIFA